MEQLEVEFGQCGYKHVATQVEGSRHTEAKSGNTAVVQLSTAIREQDGGQSTLLLLLHVLLQTTRRVFGVHVELQTKHS